MRKLRQVDDCQSSSKTYAPSSLVLVFVLSIQVDFFYLVVNWLVSFGESVPLGESVLYVPPLGELVPW
jgi:hypothetical protein